MASKDLKVKNEAAPDEVSRGIIFDGCSISQLSDIFGRDRRTVMKYLRQAGVKPCGMRNGYEIYALREAAAYLCDFDPDFIDERLRTMNPQDLPPLLSKEYWNGKRARLSFLREDGQLWETSKIQTLLGIWVKNFITSVRQASDAIDRRAILTDQQRVALQEELDSMIKMTNMSLGRALEEALEQEEARLLEAEDENDQL